MSETKPSHVQQVKSAFKKLADDQVARVEQAYAQVLQGQVDLAVTTLGPSEPPLRATPVWNDPLLFAVAPEVNVHALLVQAERALVELSRPGVAPERFAELAAELSACPTRAIGGDMGWIGPHDCEPELANELFDQRHSRWGMGVHPRLIHTGHGFHIIEVLGRRKGRPIPYLQARASIAGDLAVQRQAMARENSLRSLIGEARVQGIDVNTLLLEESLRFWCHD